jgi:hypothetical protein
MSDISRTFEFSQKDNKTHVEKSLSSMLADISKKGQEKRELTLFFRK